MREFSVDKKFIRLRFDYDKVIINLVKRAFQSPDFNEESEQWVIPKSRFNMDRLENLVSKYDFTLGDLSSELEATSDIGLPHKSEIDVIRSIIDKELNLKLTLKDYQYTGVTYMLKNKACFNADDMGLGKTGQSITAIEVGSLFPCLVIAPSGVKYNWEKEWNKWVDGRIISVIDGNQTSLDADIVVINYDILNKHLPILKEVDWASMVVDESHKVKRGATQRTKAVKKLSKSVEYKFLLTGTAITNRPEELVSQLEILGRFGELFGNWKKFVYKFCDAKKGFRGLDTSGASNTILLNKMLREKCYIRREKSEVAKQLGDIIFQDVPIKASNKSEYRKASSDIISYIQETKGLVEALSASEAEDLALINNLKRISIEGKLKGIMEWIDGFLEGTDDKLVVFGINTQPLEILSKKYKSPLVNGSTSAKGKLKAIEKFQTSKDRVIFGNMMSMGTGVDGLQYVSSHILVIQFPDTPDVLDQAVSRLHRTGQENLVNVYKTFSTYGIDNVSWGILEDKYEVTEAVIKGKIYKGKEVGTMNLELIKRIKNNAH